MKTTNYFMSEISDSMVQAANHRTLIFLGIVAIVVLFFYFLTQRIAKRHVEHGIWSRDAYKTEFAHPDDINCTFLLGITVVLFVFGIFSALISFSKIREGSKSIYKIQQNGIIWKSFNNHAFEEIDYDYVVSIKSHVRNLGEGVVDLKLLNLEGGKKELEMNSFDLSLRFQENPEEVKREILKRIPKERFLSKFNLEESSNFPKE